MARLHRLTYQISVSVVALLAVGSRSVRADSDPAFFESRIRPLLVEHCYKCHSDQPGSKVKGALRLDTKAGLAAGGENGPEITPGNPDKSRLIEAVRWQNEDLKMPPKERLTEREVADLVLWVKEGAVDPRSDVPVRSIEKDIAAARTRWPFAPVGKVDVPAVKNQAWVKGDLDRFILAKLEAKNLSPANAADKRTLIRRATFDLVGLPPTDAAVEAFVNDNAVDAFAKVVDRLLASPEYGQRWGRHWLDVVRFTDLMDARSIKDGGAGDTPATYRYRDWVVDAFNRDLPYDQFIKQQIAGDLLPAVGVASKPAGVIPTGVYAIGEWGAGDSDREKMMTDIVDDQIDLTSRAFLGMTIACARCHDHKFDPISQADYYGLAGIFFSSHILPEPGSKTAGIPLLQIPIPDAESEKQRREAQELIARGDESIKAATQRQLKRLAEENIQKSDAYLMAAWEYATRPADQQAKSVGQFAAARQLNAYVLGRWIEMLSQSSKPTRPLDVRQADIGGVKGFNGWKTTSPTGTPNAVANSTDQPIALQTLTIPPHRVAVHPSPTNGVAVAWTAPQDIAVTVRGRVKDADDKCGDGIAWRMGVRAADGAGQGLRKPLAEPWGLTSALAVDAAGEIPNGGAAELPTAKMALRAGDRLEVDILPKAEYTCDTTVVELTITEDGGAHRTWDLSADVSPDILAVVKPDAAQHVWRFDEVPMEEAGLEPPAGTSLAKWMELARSKGAAADRVRSEAASVRASLSAAAAQSNAGLPEATTAKFLSDSTSAFWSAAVKDDALFDGQEKAEIDALRGKLAAARKLSETAVPVTYGVQEGGVPQSGYAGFHDAHIMLRGRYDRLADSVPRRFPTLLAGERQQLIGGGSGRAELAQWIASDRNPLTARVMVNRIWQHHFGEGIVRTPNNFGKLGTPPTHPELLDWLAGRFVESGWSIKAMHRAIMLSATYQQSSAADAAMLVADPENMLVGRQARQRLDAESLRDAMLAVTDSLDSSPGGLAVADLLSPRRTLYLRTIRSDRSTYKMLFDGADPLLVVDRRIESTVAPQALFLLNSPFAKAQATKLAALVAKQPGDDRAKIDWLYRTLFARPATRQEADLGAAALGNWGPGGWDRYVQVLLCSNEFIYVD